MRRGLPSERGIALLTEILSVYDFVRDEALRAEDEETEEVAPRRLVMDAVLTGMVADRTILERFTNLVRNSEALAHPDPTQPAAQPQATALATDEGNGGGDKPGASRYEQRLAEAGSDVDRKARQRR